MINSGVDLDDDSEIYFFANYSQIDMDESFNYRLPVTFTGASGTEYSTESRVHGLLPDSLHGERQLPTARSAGLSSTTTSFNYRDDLYPSGYTPRFFGKTQEIFGALGFRGTNSWGMTYDLSGTLAQNYLDMSLRSSLNASLGPDTPTSFYIGKFQQQESNLNFDVTYPWEVGAFASPVTVAAGLEWRHENYQQILGDTASFAAGPYTSQPLYDCDATTLHAAQSRARTAGRKRSRITQGPTALRGISTSRRRLAAQLRGLRGPGSRCPATPHPGRRSAIRGLLLVRLHHRGQAAGALRGQ